MSVKVEAQLPSEYIHMDWGDWSASHLTSASSVSLMQQRTPSALVTYQGGPKARGPASYALYHPIQYHCCCVGGEVQGQLPAGVGERRTLMSPNMHCLIQSFVCFFPSPPHHEALGVPRPRIQPIPPAVEVQNRNHLTAREDPSFSLVDTGQWWSLSSLWNRSTACVPQAGPGSSASHSVTQIPHNGCSSHCLLQSHSE